MNHLFWLGLGIGILVGTFIGIAMMAVISCGKQNDEDGVINAESSSDQRKDA